MNQTPLTPEQVNNIKLWYDALRSGKYRAFSPPRFIIMEEGCFCANGVGYSAVLGADKFNLEDYKRYESLVTKSIASVVSVGFECKGWSFADCANFLHNHMLETYAVDLDDWPESAVAPKVATKAAAQ